MVSSLKSTPVPVVELAEGVSERLLLFTAKQCLLILAAVDVLSVKRSPDDCDVRAKIGDLSFLPV